MNKNVHLHPNSSYYNYQMCISKRQKRDIIINIIRQHKPASWFETILHAETKKHIFQLRHVLKENEWSGFYNLHFGATIWL